MIAEKRNKRNLMKLNKVASKKIYPIKLS